MRKLLVVSACLISLLVAGCSKPTCAPDAGPSDACCQDQAAVCLTNSDCCSDNCVRKGLGTGTCCIQGGCP